jgi:hypothetical protein
VAAEDDKYWGGGEEYLILFPFSFNFTSLLLPFLTHSLTFLSFLVRVVPIHALYSSTLLLTHPVQPPASSEFSILFPSSSPFIYSSFPLIAVSTTIDSFIWNL